jgi:hypothetical protein
MYGRFLFVLHVPCHHAFCDAVFLKSQSVHDLWIDLKILQDDKEGGARRIFRRAVGQSDTEATERTGRTLWAV